MEAGQDWKFCGTVDDAATLAAVECGSIQKRLNRLSRLNRLHRDKPVRYSNPSIRSFLLSVGAGILCLVCVPGTVDAQWFNDYKDLNAIYGRLDTFAADHSSLVTPINIGQSFEGRDIRGIRIAGTNPTRANRPAILLNSLVHAREWATGMTTMYAADQLLNNYATDPAIQNLLDEVEVIVIPVVNPDGYEYTWTDNRLWRKNRRPHGFSGEFGVDLNRNWGVGWGSDDGSSSDPSSDVYRGTAAFSEPETAAMRDFYVANPQIVSNIDFHLYSQLILYPNGYTTALPADYDLLSSMADEMAAAIESVHGEIYVPQAAIDLYPASGVSIDWTYGDQGVYSWTVELRPESFFPGFELPPEEIVPAAEENFAAFLSMAENTIAIARGDFDLDGSYTCADADALVAAIQNGSHQYQFDLTGDGSLDNADMLQWISNGEFLPGDADLDGEVNGNDFLTWNAHKFQSVDSWCDGDFNTDGFVDGQDFLVWNAFKFQSADVSAVPEPAGMIAGCCLGLLCLRRRS